MAEPISNDPPAKREALGCPRREVVKIKRLDFRLIGNDVRGITTVSGTPPDSTNINGTKKRPLWRTHKTRICLYPRVGNTFTGPPPEAMVEKKH